MPALRAAVQLRDVAVELGIREKLGMIVNRANSGVSVADMERTVGMPAEALIRSGGLFLVRAANEGRTVIERFPKERVTEDFIALADRLVGPGGAERADAVQAGVPRPLRSFQGTRPGLTVRGRSAARLIRLGRSLLRETIPVRRTRRRRDRRAAVLVDLLDAPQVEAIDQDHLDLASPIRWSPR